MMMDGDRIHHATAPDGTTITARLHGHGPPVVLVHGGAGDGEVAWRYLVPHLTETLTCVCMSTRGRGLSDDHADHSIGALVGDVVAVAESLGEPVAALGHSSSLALAAAAETEAIAAVAVHEPAVPALLGDDDPRPQQAIERVIGLAGEGRHAHAVRAFFEESGLFLDDEVALLAATESYALMAPNVPAWAQEMAEYGGAVEPTVLSRVTVPALLSRGSRTPDWFRVSVDHVAERLADVRVREIAGAGHMGPLVAPEPLATELVRFVTTEHHPA
jgi:pimeloyl-ACP methyl ester carboxylesterase